MSEICTKCGFPIPTERPGVAPNCTFCENAVSDEKDDSKTTHILTLSLFCFY